ncbi:MAG: YceI family protein [Saprospiraceae bacterium]|nr:YceI family protein [Saprospiraceae bacterium]
MRCPVFFFVVFINLSLFGQNQKMKGAISFISIAPQEQIKATSQSLEGLLKPNDLTFAFIVDINTFDGFNSPLQKEHFNENYMESSTYPKAKFYGRIIESIDIHKTNDETIRAKGNLEIHGVTKERIIQIQLSRKNGILTFVSKFSISLEDYRINIPRIVHQKLSDQIKVHVEGVFIP